MNREVYVFADWEEFDEPMLVGTKKICGFNYLNPLLGLMQ